VTGDPPDWLVRLVAAAGEPGAGELFGRFGEPGPGARASAVLILFGEGPEGPDLLLIERSPHLRDHPGQPAFPGGAVDPSDAGPEAAALREAHEETGLDLAGVQVLATLPAVWIPPSGFAVAPVLAWWREPSDVRAVDAREVSAVSRVALRELADPTNRVMLRHPSGWLGPAFEVRDMLVWGFTAVVLDRLLALAGWERAWDRDRFRELPAELLELASRNLRSAASDATRERPGQAASGGQSP
jgi:8-oxo-dGTP pyrophosphatase MutT (NUDIX family)